MTVSALTGDPRLDSTHYADTGCPDGVHPSCLRCPLAACRYDPAPDPTPSLKEARNKEIVAAFEREGLSAAALAERFGVSKRTVERVLRAHYEGKR